ELHRLECHLPHKTERLIAKLLPCATQVYNLGCTCWCGRVINSDSSRNESHNAGLKRYGQSATAAGRQGYRAIISLRIVALHYHLADKAHCLWVRQVRIVKQGNH